MTPTPRPFPVPKQNGNSIKVQPGGNTIIIQGGTVIQGGQILRPGGAPQPQMDPLVQLMMSQPQIDTNLVLVSAEFDPAIVNVGARSTYRLVITALDETIALPEKLPALEGVRFEESGRGQSLQNLGGLIQARSTFNYRAVASTPGARVMPSFSINVAGRKVMVPEAHLNVVPAGAPTPAAPRLTLEMPTNDIYIGQSVPARLVITDPGDNSVLALTQAHVVGDGLLAERGFPRMNRSMTVRNGQPQTTLWTELLVSPMREGPLKVFGQANTILRQTGPDRYAQLPGYYPLMDSDVVTVNVRRVPKEGQLPGYTGAIGTFVIEAPQLSAHEVQAGDPVKLQVVIRGDGNFARFTPPVPAPDPDWQVFPPNADANSGSQASGQGFAAFTYTLIPLSDRARTTPQIPFSAFDPERKTFQALTIPPVAVTVKATPRATARIRLPENATGENAESTEAPLVMAGLMEDRGVSASLVPLQQRGWFLGIQLVPTAILGGLSWWDRRRRFLAAHPEVVRKRRARRTLARELRHARHAASQSDAEGYVTAAVNALRAAAAPHEAANPQALVGRDVVRELPEGMTGEDAEIVRRLFSAADAQRITHRSDGEALLAARKDFERVAEKLEARL